MWSQRNSKYSDVVAHVLNRFSGLGSLSSLTSLLRSGIPCSTRHFTQKRRLRLTEHRLLFYVFTMIAFDVLFMLFLLLIFYFRGGGKKFLWRQDSIHCQTGWAFPQRRKRNETDTWILNETDTWKPHMQD